MVPITFTKAHKDLSLGHAFAAELTACCHTPMREFEPSLGMWECASDLGLGHVFSRQLRLFFTPSQNSRFNLLETPK